MNSAKQIYENYENATSELVSVMRELDAIAYHLYKRLGSFSEAQVYAFVQFYDEELVLLWVMCFINPSNPWGRAYDDEVYDTIKRRDNSKEIFDNARSFYYLREKYLDSEEIKAINM